jgi:hypothetical protein
MGKRKEVRLKRGGSVEGVIRLTSIVFIAISLMLMLGRKY